ncbi:MAG: pyridoxal phosphate-dependent aminotransferase [Planctomycetes bacterium]|nr:pyridoxal phosphate-dependent aminotransferase [Planctomycetota bacterium]
MRIARRATEVSLSVTLALDARAKALMAQGRDVINMSVGEPDFPAPALVQDAACKLIRSGNVRYTPAAGTLALRGAIAKYLTESRGVAFTLPQVTVCHSTKHALSGAILATIQEGDEVLLFLPAWVSYVEIVKLAGGVPISVPSRPDLGPDFDAIRRAIGPKTRAMLLNSPSNPTGYTWSRKEVEELAALAVKHDLVLLSDEIYRRLIYEGEPDFSPASVSAEVRARTVILDGASKSYAMTGYRIGFVAGPPEIAAAVERVHSHLVGAPNSVSQAGYLAALETEPPEVEMMKREFDARRRFLIPELQRMGLETPMPRGAFYAFADVGPYLDARGSTGFCEDLLEQQNLALVPGSAFGVDTHVRLSYALGLDRIRHACERLAAFLAAHPRAPAAARR